MIEHIDVLQKLRDASMDEYFYPSREQRAALNAAISAITAQSDPVAWGLFKSRDGSLYSFCNTEANARLYQHDQHMSRDDITLTIAPLFTNRAALEVTP